MVAATIFALRQRAGARRPAGDTRVLGPPGDRRGLVIIGAALGIGGLARAAVESMARQPETAGNIQTAMIIAAALIEGVTFFALIIILIFVIAGRPVDPPGGAAGGGPAAPPAARGRPRPRGPGP